jgi:hypothetical protein
MAQIVHTICLQSQDAARVDEATSTYTWDLPGDCGRYHASRLQLGSIEMDMPQWNVEEDWQNVYFMERFRVPSDDRSVELKVTDLGASSSSLASSVHATLPAVLNPIVRWKRGKDGWCATTQHPHGLRAWDGRSLLAAATWDPVRVVASPAGSFVLRPESVSFPEDDEILVRSAPDGQALRDETDSARCGALYVPPPRDPTDVCQYLERSLAGMPFGLRVRMRYDARENRVDCRLSAPSFPGSPSTVRVQWSDGTALPRALGIHGLLVLDVRLGGGIDATESVTVASAPQSCVWARAALTPGVYVPTHRPVTTGQPLRFSKQFADAFHRLQLEPPERIATGQMTSYFLVFEDHRGFVERVAVPCGRYTPDALCRSLAADMTALVRRRSPDASFDVSYDARGGRYVFRCTDGPRGPARFALLFASDSQFDPEHLGFPRCNLYGSSEYTSAFPAHFPDVSGGEVLRAHGATPPQRSPAQRYSVETHGETQTLTLEAMEGRDLVARVLRYDPAHNALVLRTHVGILPYAHGFLPGDVLRVVPMDDDRVDVLGDGDDSGAWGQEQVTPCLLFGDAYAFVVPPPPETSAAREDSSETLELCTLWLRTRASTDAARCVDTAFVVRPASHDALNLCCGSTMWRSVWPRMLGLGNGATLQSEAGAVVGDGGRRTGPVRTAHFSLDSPDYVLIYLEDAKRGTLLQHVDRGAVTTPFAKLVLTPLFRDERMLPKDTYISSAECLTRVSLRFANPNGVPYRWHNAPFAVSMNLIRADG